MPERASVSQAVQLGVESTPGTAVAANKLLNSLSISPGVQVDMQQFRPTGQKYDSIITPGKEWVEASIEGVGSYSELTYLLSGIGVVTTGVQDGATTSYTWTFTPAARTADTVKTFTVEQGDAVRAHKFAYGMITQLDLGFSRDGVTLGGAMLGQALSDGITMTGSPTAVEEKPILPTHIDVFLDPTFGAIGTTRLTRAIEANISIGDRFNPVWVLNSTLGSFVAHVETVPSVEVELLVQADAQGMGLLTQLRSGGTQYLRIQATHTDLAGTGFPYQFKFDMASKINNVDDFSDEDGVYAIKWTNRATYDATNLLAWRATTRNKLVTL